MSTPENTQAAGNGRRPDPPLDRRWRPGQSGNPGGRPRELVEVKALARKYTRAAITELVRILKHGTREQARVLAAQALLDRAWGKPTQEMKLTGVDGGPFVFTLQIGRIPDAVNGDIPRALGDGHPPA